MSEVSVLYIASDSRSGSTILDLIVGRGEGFFSAGEVRHIWERGYLNNELCGCHTPFNECSFWSEVTRQAFGDLATAQAKAREYAALGIPRTRNMPRLLAPTQSRQMQDGVVKLSADLACLYQAIQRVSGARVIVDSSKVPTHGLILSRIPEIGLSLLHLVRDSRAVAYSWLRKKVRPDVHWKQDFMPQFSLLHSGRNWVLMNLLIEQLARQQTSHLFVRYEEMVASPRQMLAQLAEYLEEPGLERSLPTADVLDLGVNHTVSGNPVRFQAREIRLKPDSEWQTKMKPSQKAIITAMTWPLLLKYGYLKSEPRPQAQAQAQASDVRAPGDVPAAQ